MPKAQWERLRRERQRGNQINASRVIGVDMKPQRVHKAAWQRVVISVQGKFRVSW